MVGAHNLLFQEMGFAVSGTTVDGRGGGVVVI